MNEGDEAFLDSEGALRGVPRPDAPDEPAEIVPGPGEDLDHGPQGRAAPAPPSRRLSGFWRYALRRLLLIPPQLLFILFVLYLAIQVPTGLSQTPPETSLGFVQGYFQLVFNVFTGNWGTSIFLRADLPITQIYAYVVPTSVQLALFALPISAALAYPISLAAGWSRRPGLDAPARFVTLTGALLPVFVVGTLVVNAIFFSYLHWFGDLPSQGLIPSTSWFVDNGGFPSWILYDSVTQPTGFPLIDALIHHAWTFGLISLSKTLIQASVVAMAYVAIFFRHSRSIVRQISEEPYITGARARGVSERTLLWRHTARRVAPSFLLVFAMTIPEYLCVQFAVEIAFVDFWGFGYLTFTDLTEGLLNVLYTLVFLIAILVLVWTLVVDLIAVRLDPRGVVGS